MKVEKIKRYESIFNVGYKQVRTMYFDITKTRELNNILSSELLYQQIENTIPARINRHADANRLFFPAPEMVPAS